MGTSTTTTTTGARSRTTTGTATVTITTVKRVFTKVMISQVLERILMKNILSKNSWGFELQTDSISSIRIFSITWDKMHIPKWKWKIIQQCEYDSSPSRASFGIHLCSIDLPVLPFDKTIVDLVDSWPGWWGVPHFVRNGLEILPKKLHDNWKGF